MMEKFVNPITKEEQDILTRPVDPETIQIKPDGTLYIPHQDYRRTLIEAFGVGGWQPGSDAEIYEKEKVVCYKASFYVKGHLISVPVGGCENIYMGYDDRVETARGDWLKRGCKDLGVFLDIPARGKEKRGWLKKYAIKVKVFNKKGDKNRDEYLWRRHDDLSFPDRFWYYDKEEVIEGCELLPKTISPTHGDGPRQDGKKQNVSTGRSGVKPDCPKCKHNKHVIAAKFKVGEKGEWLCWKKKEQEPTGCGEQFNTAPPKNAPGTLQDAPAPQATNGSERSVTLISTLNKLVDNKALFDQIPDKERDKIIEILISDIDPNHEGVRGWIGYLTKCYAKLDKNTVVEKATEKKKVTTAQLRRLMTIATKNGWSEEDVSGTIKKVLNLDSKTDIPVSHYDEIVEMFSIEKVPF